MKFISENKISEELVNSFDEEMTFELAKRLEEDNYNTPFDGLKDWHLLRALAINRPELTTNYTHLLDQEPFDEEMTFELAKRLEEDNYNTPFDGLKDWHLLRALAINRPELTTNYTHLLDQEPFDEN